MLSGVESICADLSDSWFTDPGRWVKRGKKIHNLLSQTDLETAHLVVLARGGMAMDNESVGEWRKELQGGCFPRGLGKSEENCMEIPWDLIEYCLILLFHSFLGNFYWLKIG